MQRKRFSRLVSTGEYPSMYSIRINKKESNIHGEMLNVIIARFFESNSLLLDDDKSIRYGFYTRDVAETKISEVCDFASSSDKNLTIRCVVEKQISGVDQDQD